MNPAPHSIFYHIYLRQIEKMSMRLILLSIMQKLIESYGGAG